MGGWNSGTALRDVEKFDVNGNLIETLPLLGLPRYMIYLIASKESPHIMNALYEYQTRCVNKFAFTIFVVII